MLKDIYKSAMSKVKADTDFYEKVHTLWVQPEKRKNRKRNARLVPALLVLAIAVFAGILVIQNNRFKYTKISDDYFVEYISVVYLDGYSYRPLSIYKSAAFKKEFYLPCGFHIPLCTLLLVLQK